MFLTSALSTTNKTTTKNVCPSCNQQQAVLIINASCPKSVHEIKSSSHNCLAAINQSPCTGLTPHSPSGSMTCITHLTGLVVKASASRAEDEEFDSRLRRGDFSESSHTSDLKIGTPVAILPFAWRYWVSAGTGWPVVIIL